MSKRTAVLLVVGALVFGLAAGSVGIAYAQTDEAGERPRGLLGLLADLTGMSSEELIEQRQDGTSFPKIAEEAGVSTDEIIDEIYSERSAHIQELLSDGQITQEQADWALENMREQIEARVLSDGIGPGRGGPGGRRGPGMQQDGQKPGFGEGGPGCWGPPPADESPTTDSPQA